MLLGNRITVYTDHRNLTHTDTKHTCDRVLRQRLLLEEYGCELKYIKGKKNVVADTLSRLDFAETTTEVCEHNLIKYVYEDHVKVPVDLAFIAQQQAKDSELQAGKEKCPKKFKDNDLGGGAKLTLYRKNEETEQFLVYVPASMAKDMID